MVSSRGFNGFVESPHCEIGFPKALFGVVSSFSAALFVPSGFNGFVESPHCEIGFPKALFGVVSSFSAALFVPSGFID